MALMPTPSQTVGPFFHIGLTYEGTPGPQLVSPDDPDAMLLSGTVASRSNLLIIRSRALRSRTEWKIGSW